MPLPTALKTTVEKALAGLKFQTNREVKKEGEPTRFVPAERAMELDDVLDARMVGGQLVLVTADGRKHRLAVESSEKKDDKKEDKKDQK